MTKSITKHQCQNEKFRNHMSQPKPKLLTWLVHQTKGILKLFPTVKRCLLTNRFLQRHEQSCHFLSLPKWQSGKSHISASVLVPDTIVASKERHLHSLPIARKTSSIQNVVAQTQDDASDTACSRSIYLQNSTSWPMFQLQKQLLHQ